MGGQIKGHTHEEGAAARLSELLGVNDIGFALKQEVRNSRHQTATVGARKCQDHWEDTPQMIKFCAAVIDNHEVMKKGQRL